MNLNQVILVGNLAEDVVYTAGTTTKSSRSVSRLIVNRTPSNDGKNKYDAIQIVAWGSLADALAQYSSKGKELTITGELRVNSIPPKKQGGSWVNYTEVQIKTVSFGRDSAQGKAMKILQGAQDTLDSATQVQQRASVETEISTLAAHPNIKEIMKTLVKQGMTASNVLPPKTQSEQREVPTAPIVETPFG